MHRGSCLCGNLSYTLDGALREMSHCHCSMCRKHHGSAFATFVLGAARNFRYLRGETSIATYRSSEHGRRSFCSTCGSVAPTFDVKANLVVVPAGNLVGELGLTPSLHIFTASKAVWYEITDDLPQHGEYPPEYAQYGVRAVPGPQVDHTATGTRGSCLCGAVAYELESAADGMRNCHCSRCRRGRSAAHGTNLYCEVAKLRITRGADAITTFKLPDARFFKVGFCMHCGGAAPHTYPERNMAIIPAGTLDTDPGLRPDGHIFVGSKAPWFTIHDGLPQYPERS